MKAYLKFILSALVSTLAVGSASAENWTVDGVAQPTPLTSSATESAVAVDPDTGFVSVKTAGSGPSMATNAQEQNQSQAAPLAISDNPAGGIPPGAGWSVNGVTQLTPLTTSTTESAVAVDPLTGATAIKTATALCASRPPAVFGSPRTLINQTFFSMWNTNFPGLFNTAFGAGVPGVADGTVIAFSFVAPVNNTIEGYILAAYSPNSSGRGSLAAGFSECPGEINAMTPTCNPGLGKIRNEWTTTGRPGACNLVAGRTYYYNVSVENSCVVGPDPGKPGGVCSFRLVSTRYF